MSRCFRATPLLKILQWLIIQEIMFVILLFLCHVRLPEFVIISSTTSIHITSPQPAHLPDILRCTWPPNLHACAHTCFLLKWLLIWLNSPLFTRDSMPLSAFVILLWYSLNHLNLFLIKIRSYVFVPHFSSYISSFMSYVFFSLLLICPSPLLCHAHIAD